MAAEPPAWAVEAVWYQIFPERFHNGDRSNDPTRDSLENADWVSPDWRVSPWTASWYHHQPWEENRNFYEVATHRRYGGDLAGIIQRLDYLKDLGVGALYLNPIFAAPSAHKYDASALHHIDPHFGPDPAGDKTLMRGETEDPATWKWTAADRLFLELLSAAKERGIRVIIDGVFNHTGRKFFAFRDLKDRGESSKYRDWYRVERFDDPATDENEFRVAGWQGHDALPEFARSADGGSLAAGPSRYIAAVTRRWMDPNGDGDPVDGVDGWRLDVAEEVPAGFWKSWHGLVRSLNASACTVAECWKPPGELIESAGFDGATNYAGFAYPMKGAVADRAHGTVSFWERFHAAREQTPRAVLWSLLSSHDTPRWESVLMNRGLLPYADTGMNDYDRWGVFLARESGDFDLRAPEGDEVTRLERLSVLLQMTLPGPPMIYYGEECGMWGGDDPDCRQPMLWPGMAFEDLRQDPRWRELAPQRVAFDEDEVRFYQALIRLRKERAAFLRGGLEVELPGRDDVICFSRRADGGDEVWTLANPAREPAAMTLAWNSESARPVVHFSTLGPGVELGMEVAGGALHLSVPALSGWVMDRLTPQ